MREELERMVEGLQRLGIAETFPRIHHFASPKYKSKPSRGLEEFRQYCLERTIRHANIQTIYRAKAVISALGQVDNLDPKRDVVQIDIAIDDAWKAFPV